MPISSVARAALSAQWMRVDSKLRQRLVAGGSIVVALTIGWQVAESRFALAGLLAVAATLLTVNVVLGLAPDVWAMGLVLIGYLVGNRGFAQLHPPNTPFLPAESVLAIAVILGAWRWAWDRRIPFRSDALNVLLTLWIVLAAVRLPLDFRQAGFVAVRDFAMVYYAAFFYLVQDWAREENSRRFLERCLTIGLALTTPAFLAFTAWPEWFESRLVIAGIPLIFVKSDVAGGFMAGGVFFFAERFTRTKRAGWLALSSVSLLGVALSNSRAAAVATVGGFIWLVALRRWKTFKALAALGAVALLALALQAMLTRKPIETTPVYRAYEVAASILDFSGTRTYRRADLGDKPDNNQFRLVWWRTVINDTWEEGRWLGLGFGKDLAEDFVRIYNPGSDEEFTARSPHNFVLSVFARMGLLGLTGLLAVLAIIARQTLRAAANANDDSSAVALWLAGWCIFISACFGVVLEGPMAAVVFWTTLGLANAQVPMAASGGETYSELSSTSVPSARA